MKRHDKPPGGDQLVLELDDGRRIVIQLQRLDVTYKVRACIAADQGVRIARGTLWRMKNVDEEPVYRGPRKAVVTP